MEIRRSYDRLISTMGFPILVRRHLYIESGSKSRVWGESSPHKWPVTQKGFHVTTSSCYDEDNNCMTTSCLPHSLRAVWITYVTIIARCIMEPKNCYAGKWKMIQLANIDVFNDILRSSSMVQNAQAQWFKTGRKVKNKTKTKQL